MEEEASLVVEEDAVERDILEQGDGVRDAKGWGVNSVV